MLNWSKRSYLNMLGKGLLGLIAIIIFSFIKLFNLRSGIDKNSKEINSQSIWIKKILNETSILDSLSFCKKYKNNFKPNEVADFYRLYNGKLSSTLLSEDFEGNVPYNICYKDFNVNKEPTLIQILVEDSIVMKFNLISQPR